MSLMNEKIVAVNNNMSITNEMFSEQIELISQFQENLNESLVVEMNNTSNKIRENFLHIEELNLNLVNLSKINDENIQKSNLKVKKIENIEEKINQINENLTEAFEELTQQIDDSNALNTSNSSLSDKEQLRSLSESNAYLKKT